MGLRERWNDLGTGGKVLVGLLVGGVVLVVGLVVLVLLAAVIGSFALGMGESSGTSPPQVSFSADYDDSAETVELTHSGGESVDAAALIIETDEQTFEWEDDDGNVTAGESTVVDASSGTTVRILWTGDGESAVLFRGTME